MDPRRTAIVLIDHGSRRPEANEQLGELASLIAIQRPDWLIRCAHLEVCPPYPAEVIADCVSNGAQDIVLHPFFLLPGRHSQEDLPRIAEEATLRHPGLRVRVTGTLGLDPLLVEVVLNRIEQTVAPKRAARGSNSANEP